MSQDVVVVTTMLGGRDRVLYSQPPGSTFRAIAFSDGDHVRIGDGWQVLPATRHLDYTPMRPWTRRLATKWYKFNFPAFEECLGAKALVWMDATMQVTSSDFSKKVLSVVSKMSSPMACWHHLPDRTWGKEFLAAEGACLAEGSDELDRHRRQAAAYWEEGMPKDLAPIFTGGFLVMNPKHPSLNALLQAWWSENEKHGTRDQVSLPYVIRSLGIDVEPLSKFLPGNNLYVLRAHNSGQTPVQQVEHPAPPPLPSPPQVAVKKATYWGPRRAHWAHKR